MAGNIDSGKNASHEASEPDLPDAKAGDHSTAPAEIFPPRQPHDFIEALHGSPLNDGQDLALMNLIKNGDFDAKQNMIARNLRLVLNNTRRYASKGVRLFDLLKAGNLGLEHALENFEPEGKEHFSTYAARCIRRNIEHVILNWDGHSPAWLEKPDHNRYRIVAGGDADPSPAHLILESALATHDQIN